MDGAAGMRQLHASAEDRDKVHRDLSLRPRNLKEGADDERMERRGKKSAPKAPKTLKIVFDTLIDQRVLIELRNDTTISGILDFVDPELNIELSDVLCRRATDAADTHLDMLYVNGRYIRYVHIPEGIEIVEAVHRRVQAQTKAQNSHRRTADVIREAIARREAVRGAQLDAISDVPGQTTVASSKQQSAPKAVKVETTEEAAAAAAAAEAAGFSDISLSCRDCKQPFCWSARQQLHYQNKGLANAPKRCMQCLKKQRDRKERQK